MRGSAHKAPIPRTGEINSSNQIIIETARLVKDGLCTLTHEIREEMISVVFYWAFLHRHLFLTSIYHISTFCAKEKICSLSLLQSIIDPV